MIETFRLIRVLGIAVLTLMPLGSGTLFAWQDDSFASKNRPTATAVDAEGNINIDSAVLQIAESVEIPATAAGPLRKIAVAQGDLISQDQLLAIVEDRDAAFQLQEAELDYKIVLTQAISQVDIEFAKKSRQVAKVDLKRAEESNQAFAGVVSDREMDRLQLTVEQSDAELEKIRFEKSLLAMQAEMKKVIVAKKKNELERYRIKSAVSGQVVEVAKRSGEWVDVSETVFRVVRLDRLRVEEYLPATVATAALKGASATFFVKHEADREIALHGKVVFVSPSVDPINSTVQVWIEFDNPSLRIRPGTRGEIRLHSSTGESTTDRGGEGHNH